MARTLAQFTITPDGQGDYALNLEDEDGESVDFIASNEHLDLIIEAIDDLRESEEADLLGADDDEESDEEV